MKKKLLIILTATATLCGTLALSACDGCNGGHTHDYGGWKTDKVYHWHECKNDGCDEKIKDKTAHADSDNDGECDECGYPLPVVSHTHDYSTEWSTNDTYHWHECKNDGCNAKVIDKGIHFDADGDGGCDECGADVETGGEVHVHPLTFFKMTEATCTADGNSAYYACEVCNKIFFDARGTHEITDATIVVIPKIKHDITYKKANEPTCTANGNTAYYECNYCSKWFEDENGEKEITDKATAVIPPAHKMTLIPLSLPTCIAYGNTAYYDCDECGKWFEDENGEKEITDKKSVLITERADHKYEGKTCTVCGKTKPSDGLRFTDKGSYFEVGAGTATDVDVVIPDEYEGKPVKAIGADAFRGHAMTSILIPDGITDIGNGAFRGCGNLISVTLPDSVIHIGEEVFFGCSNMKSVDTGAGITAIGKNAFRNCLKLATIKVSGKVTHIGEGAFYRCPSLTDITIPAGTSIIDSNAFELCENLTIYCEAASKPEGWDAEWNRCSGGVVTDGQMTEKVYCPVVWDCKNNDLAEDGNIYVSHEGIRYTIKDGVATVAVQTVNLSGQITVQKSVTHKGDSYPVTAIAEKAFRGCASLTVITIPESIAYVGVNAFDGCRALTIYCKTEQKPAGWEVSENGSWNNSKCPVVWDCDNNNTASDGRVYFVADGLRYTIDPIKDRNAKLAIQRQDLSGSVTIPKTVTYLETEYTVTGIGDLAFSGCAGLTSVTIPYGVTFIGYRSFYRCISLSKVTIANSMKSIGMGAFRECANLTEIKYNGSVASWKSITKSDYWNLNTGEYTVYCNSGATVSKDEDNAVDG